MSVSVDEFNEYRIMKHILRLEQYSGLRETNDEKYFFLTLYDGNDALFAHDAGGVTPPLQI